MRNHAEKPSFMPDAEPRHDSSEVVHEAHQRHEQSQKSDGLTPEQLRDRLARLTPEEKKRAQEKRAANEGGADDTQKIRMVRETIAQQPPIAPTDVVAARFSAQMESTSEPKGLWGRLKSWLNGESAYRKFGQMQADSDRTPTDTRAELKGEQMMYKQDIKEAKDELRKERIEAKNKHRTKEAASKIELSNLAPTIEEEEQLRNRGAQIAKERNFKPLPGETDQMWETGTVSKDNDWQLAPKSAMRPENIKQQFPTQKWEETTVGQRTVDKKIITPLEESHNRAAEQKLLKKVEKQELKENAVSPQEFSKLMKAGKFRAKAEKLEEEAEAETRPGPYAKKGKENMERLTQTLERINDRLTELQPIVESTKLGIFAYLKINNKGYITNLPEGNEDIVLEYLAKEKERLGTKGKIEKANKIVEQMEALPAYTQLLAERDKVLASAGQDN